MRLELTVLRCPDAVPPEARTVLGGEFSVGRGPGVDWILPDVERTLSKRHFVVAYRSGAWQLADTSTNGTFLNTDQEAVGGGELRTLRDGDRIRVGAYEIEARLTEDAQPYGGSLNTGFSGASRAGSDPFGDPFGVDPFAPPPAAHRPFGEASPAIHESAPLLPDDFDLLSPSPVSRSGGGLGAQPFQTAVQSDHSSVMQDAFQPPAPAAHAPVQRGGVIPADNLLPDDWANDVLEGIGAPIAPAPQPAPPVPPPVIAPPPAPPVTRAGASPFDEPSDVQGGGLGLGPPIASLAPAAVRAASVFEEAPAEKVSPLPPARNEPLAVPPSAPLPVNEGPADRAAVGDQSLLAAFLAGADMPLSMISDPVATMRGLGAAFRSMVAGLREVLIARASIKSEFRIEQTMIRARGNNPLKFSAGDDDALSALLGSSRRVDMTPSEAVDDALKDIRLHELATMAAMQSAVRAMLEGLDPAKLRSAADQGGMTVLPAQRKARAWDAFEALHAQTLQALSDDFDSVFGKAFARSYERAMQDISTKERR